MYGKALFIVVVLIIIYAFTCAFGWDVRKMSKVNNPVAWILSNVKGADDEVSEVVDELDQPFSLTSNKDESNIDELATLEGFDGQENAIGNVGVYDPLTMGAVKKKELDAHYKNLKNRTPYSSVGSIQPSRVRRDDDPYARETGVPWVGGLPSRAFNRKIGGPQAGARDSISASSKSVVDLHKSARKAPVWIS